MCNHEHVIVIVIKIIDFTSNHNRNHLKKAWCNHNHNHAAVIGPNPDYSIAIQMGRKHKQITKQMSVITKVLN